MTPSELLYKLKNLPPETPITAEHIVAILGALQAPHQVASNQAGSYSTWDPDKRISPETLAEWIGESTDRLKKWRVAGVGPKFLKGEKHVTYRVGDVRDWIAERTVQSTTQADRLKLASYLPDCYLKPSIFHEGYEEPVDLFRSIELVGAADTITTGFEVLAAASDSPVALYFAHREAKDSRGLLEALGREEVNQVLSFYLNGEQQHATLAHLLARYPFPDDDQLTLLTALSGRGLDLRKEDSTGRTALDYGSDLLERFNTAKELAERLEKELPPAPKRRRIVDI